MNIYDHGSGLYETVPDELPEQQLGKSYQHEKGRIDNSKPFDLNLIETKESNMNTWDNTDDYYNIFYVDGAEGYELVIRKYEHNFLIYIEHGATGSLIKETSYDSYENMEKDLNCLCVKHHFSLPTEQQLDDVEGPHDDYEICTECHDPDCIEETGGCNE